jgi:hypothetical protein
MGNSYVFIGVWGRRGMEGEDTGMQGSTLQGEVQGPGEGSGGALSVFWPRQSGGQHAGMQSGTPTVGGDGQRGVTAWVVRGAGGSNGGRRARWEAGEGGGQHTGLQGGTRTVSGAEGG